MKSFFPTVLALLLTSNAFAKSLIFKLDDTIKFSFKSKDFFSESLSINGNEIESVNKRLFNPWREYERTYSGYAFYELLDAVYGKNWKKAHKITFVALDGYRQTAKIKDMLKTSIEKIGYIAFSETGKKGFSPFKRGNKNIDPGPFYLVWSGFKKGDKAKHSDILKWPYQLKTVTLKSAPSK